MTKFWALIRLPRDLRIRKIFGVYSEVFGRRCSRSAKFRSKIWQRVELAKTVATTCSTLRRHSPSLILKFGAIFSLFFGCKNGKKIAENGKKEEIKNFLKISHHEFRLPGLLIVVVLLVLLAGRPSSAITIMAFASSPSASTIWRSTSSLNIFINK